MSDICAADELRKVQWLEQINMHTYDFCINYFGIVSKMEDEVKLFSVMRLPTK
jgi:hypothetical protein